MSNEKLDRRKKYTRMVLKESLMELLKEKPIAAITVKEICEVADINRSTFYSHFADHYALLAQIEEELIYDLNEYLNQINLNADTEALQITEKIIEYVAVNKDVCQILLSEHLDSAFLKRVVTVAHDYTVKSLIDSKNLEEDLSSYASLFAIYGSIHVIEHWLKNGMDKSPGELAEITTKLTNNGLNGL
ncbi:TetR/AcrR family transcriptional regulator [Radiobacillus sp. PE A8.2]|uniref:TetR/AcrR family transcriptional regulator n=1 Tax=Radiobacillus sp. PE A8.2 TaxID=3380349 RepID=UPI00388EC463